MTMEDKEIRFWAAHPEFDIPFLEECDMSWEEIHNDYQTRMQRERNLGIDNVRKVYEEVISNMTKDDLDALEEEGKLPSKLEKIIDVDPVTGNFVSKDYPDIVIGTISDIFDAIMFSSELGIDDSDIE
jgi:hypothetical protein